jgi:hypothetical protein
MKRKNCVGQGWSARGTKGPRARVKLYLWDTCMGVLARSRLTFSVCPNPALNEHIMGQSPRPLSRLARRRARMVSSGDQGATRQSEALPLGYLHGIDPRVRCSRGTRRGKAVLARSRLTFSVCPNPALNEHIMGPKPPLRPRPSAPNLETDERFSATRAPQPEDFHLE